MARMQTAKNLNTDDFVVSIDSSGLLRLLDASQALSCLLPKTEVTCRISLSVPVQSLWRTQDACLSTLIWRRLRHRLYRLGRIYHRGKSSTQEQRQPDMTVIVRLHRRCLIPN